MELKNTTVVITGASRGIGKSLAQALAQKNTRIVGVSRKFDPHFEKDLLGLGASSVRLISADLSARESVQKVLSQLESEEIDVFINNAGLLTGGLLENQPLDEVLQMLQVNVNAVIQLTHGILPKMLARKKGKIVNNSSVAGVMHFPCSSTYSASKAAVIAFTTSLNNELKNTGVSTLLLITPGVETEMFNDIPKKYGKNLNVNLLKSIPVETYAKRVVRAIETDRSVLSPHGTSGLGVALARWTPRLFYSAVNTQFTR